MSVAGVESEISGDRDEVFSFFSFSIGVIVPLSLFLRNGL